MAEVPDPAKIDTRTTSDIILGPTHADIAGYSELINALQSNEPIGFSPRVIAENTFLRLDDGTCGTFIDAAGLKEDKESARKLVQQRYIAGVLGLKVSPTRVDTHAGTAVFTTEIPELDEAPPIPAMDAKGRYLDQSGAPLRPVPRDMLFAARFLAQNRETFMKKNAFTKLAHRVVEQAESGSIIVHDKVGNPQGAMSLVRQVARVLGYQVDVFTKTDEGTFIMKVDGLQKGFESNNTVFKVKGSVTTLEKII